MIKTTIFENIGVGPHATDTITVIEHLDYGKRSVFAVVHGGDGNRIITKGKSYSACVESALTEAVQDKKTRAFIRAHIVEI